MKPAAPTNQLSADRAPDENGSYSGKPRPAPAAPQQAPARSGRFRRIAGNIAALFGSLLLGVLLFEAIYRIYPFESMGRQPADDRPTAYFRPHGMHHRSDYIYPKEKPAGVFRIVTVGDSFTYPTYMQFDDAFPKRIERILNLAHPQEKRAEVINFGKMGLSTRREVDEVARALGHSPDLILLEITLNDAELTNFHAEQKRHPGKFNFGETKITAENHPLLVHFRGLSFLYERLHRIGATSNVADYYLASFKNADNRRIFQQSLSEIKALTDKAGVRLAVVIFPMFYTDIDEDYPFAEIHTMIHDDLNARGIKFVDIRSEFTGIPHTRLNVMVGKDTHPNEIAHRIAADAIYRWLLDQELVPADLKAPIQDMSEPADRRRHHHKKAEDK